MPEGKARGDRVRIVGEEREEAVSQVKLDAKWEWQSMVWEVVVGMEVGRILVLVGQGKLQHTAFSNSTLQYRVWDLPDQVRRVEVGSRRTVFLLCNKQGGYK
jgi:hypothetical protein